MNLLSIGGSDPSSGAGIQSDIKTFSTLNVHGLTVITAITGQNTSNFGMIEPISKKILENQLESVITDFKIDGIKIGMVYNSEIIKTIYQYLKNNIIHITKVIKPGHFSPVRHHLFQDLQNFYSMFQRDVLKRKIY